MKAVVMREFGGPEVLRYEDVPDPRPQAGEVLLRVRAVSVNRTFDLKVRQDGNNRNPVLPLVLGADPSGEIVELGPGVEGFRLGDRVVVEPTIPCLACDECRRGREEHCSRKRMFGVHRWGGYAQYTTVPTGLLYPIPDGLGFMDATVILRHVPTAIALAQNRAQLQPGETVLVMGAAGALGSVLVQVAKVAGATVIAAAGADERVSAARELGADYGVNYRQQDLAAEVMKITGGRGVEVVFENIADPTLWPGAYNSLAYEGRLVTNGAHGGGSVTLDVRRLYGKHLSVLGGVSTTKDDVRQAFVQASAGRVKAVVGAVLPLEQASEAHRLAERGTVVGKIILEPN